MGLSIAPLLIHHPAVPLKAREALKAATSAPDFARTAALESAARVLFSETDLDCGEAREIVGLDPGGCCA